MRLLSYTHPWPCCIQPSCPLLCLVFGYCLSLMYSAALCHYLWPLTRLGWASAVAQSWTILARSWFVQWPLQSILQTCRVAHRARWVGLMCEPWLFYMQVTGFLRHVLLCILLTNFVAVVVTIFQRLRCCCRADVLLDPSAQRVDLFVHAEPPWRCPLLEVKVPVINTKHSITHWWWIQIILPTYGCYV